MANIVSSVGSDPSRDYADLPLWHTARLLVHTDLVADGDNEIAECYDDGQPVQGAGVSIAGWTADADNRVIVRTGRGQRHDGTERVKDGSGNGAWCSSIGVSTATPMIKISQPFTEVDGLRFFDNAASTRQSLIMDGMTGGQTATAIRCLAHGDLGTTSGRFGIGTFAGSGVNEFIFIGCIAMGAGGFVINAFTSSASLGLRIVNCTALDGSPNFATAQGGGGSAFMEIINTISLSPGSEHYENFAGLVPLTGKGNIEDDSPVASTLPDDDASFPLLTDVEVVREEDNPSPVPRLILRNPENENGVTPLVSEFCLAVGNGAPDAVTEEFQDINGLEIPDPRHRGAHVPVAAGPHVVLVNL